MILKTASQRRFFLVLLIFFIGLWNLGFVVFSFSVTGKAPAKKDLQTHDAIIVLTGGKDRVKTGLSLLADHKGENLFISGVDQNITLSDILSMVPVALPTDTKECCIILGHKAQNTAGNAKEVKEWIEREQISSVLLVTSFYHIPRSVLEFRHLMPTMDMTPYPVVSRGRYPWLMMFYEYNKTILTKARLMIFR